MPLKFCVGVDGQRCGALFQPARGDRGRCPRCRALHNQRRSKVRRVRTKAQGYESTAWRKVSRELRERFPVCQRCGRRPSERAHHRHGLRPVDPGGLEPANLLALCESCHQQIHAELRRAKKAPRDAA
jgi:5-methylcytosine-specific restriction endonuclease McrA